MSSRVRKGPKTKALITSMALAYVLLVGALYIGPMMADMYADSIYQRIPDTPVEYSLSFPVDGNQSHYYVERHDTGAYGRITVSFYKQNNTVEVDAMNIKVLEVRAREVFEDEVKTIIGLPPGYDSNLYKHYFLEQNNGHMRVMVNLINPGDEPIQELRFTDVPEPFQVFVDGLEWEKGNDYNWNEESGIAVSHVPAGNSVVDIYFECDDSVSEAACSPREPPVAFLDADRQEMGTHEVVNLDASASEDSDGQIIRYYWDMGDGIFRASMTPYMSYSYTAVGNFTVVLTVEDSDGLLDHAYCPLNVTHATTKLAPDAAIQEPMNGDRVRQVVDVIVSDALQGDDISSATLQYIDGAVWKTLADCMNWERAVGCDYQFNTTQFPDGTLDMRVFLNASDGLSGTTQVVSVVVDNTPPTLTLLNSWQDSEFLGGWNTSWVLRDEAFVDSDIDQAGITFQHSSDEFVDMPTEAYHMESYLPGGDTIIILDSNFVPDGIHGFRIKLTDEAGNVAYTTSLTRGVDNRNPTAVIEAPGSAFEDQLITFIGFNSSDHDGSGIVNYTWYFGDGERAITANATHTYRGEGERTVLLVVEDSAGNIGMATHDIRILNQGPNADAGGPYSVEEGDEITFDASNSFDSTSDNPTLFYSWDLDGDGEFDDGAGSSPSRSWPDDGDYTIWLKVEDNDGNSSLDSAQVHVLNAPPVADAGGPYLAVAGKSIKLTGEAVDPGTDTFLFRWDFNSDGSWDTQWSSSSFASFVYSPSGNYTATLEVRDDDGGHDTSTASVSATYASLPPRFEMALRDAVIHFSSPYSIDLSNYISDPDTPFSALSFRLEPQSQAQYASFSGGVLTINHPDQGAEVDMIVMATDGTSEASDTFHVSVTDNYVPRLSTALPDISFDEGFSFQSAIDLDDHFTDDDGILTHYYLQRIPSNIHVQIDPDTNIVSFVPKSQTWSGSENLVFIAEDDRGATAEDGMRVEVRSINYPPTLQAIPQPLYIPYGFELSLDLGAYAQDDDPVEMNIFSTNKSWVEVKGTTLVFNYDRFVDPNFDPSSPVYDQIEIRVEDPNDNTLFASTSMEVVVSSNRPPYTEPSVPDIVFDEDTSSQSFSLADHFKDHDGVVESFTASSRNSNISVQVNSAGVVSITSVDNWHGSSVVVFGATDDQSAAGWATIRVTVTQVNDAPTQMREVVGAVLAEGQIWSINLNEHFQDIDGDPLNFTVNNPSITIDSNTGIATWRPTEELTRLEGVVFAATDGNSAPISSAPIDLEMQITPFPWHWIVLAVMLGALGMVAFRAIKYRYTVEEIFLMDLAGILMAHTSRRGESITVDEKIVGGMLTAVQDFVKDAMKDDDDQKSQKTLNKLEYGDYQIIMERGKLVLLVVVISGYENNKLRKKMTETTSRIEAEYGDTLRNWDGDMTVLAPLLGIIEALLNKEKKKEENKKERSSSMEQTVDKQATSEQEGPEEEQAISDASEEASEEELGKEPEEAPEEALEEKLEEEHEKEKPEEPALSFEDELSAMPVMEYECPECGAALSPLATKCSDCGAEFE